MGTIALSIPQVSLSDSTEDPKVASNFTTLQTLLNGNVDTNNLSSTAGVTDTQLASPNNAVRRLVLQAVDTLDFTMAGSTKLLPVSTTPATIVGDSAGAFAVAGKTLKARIRVTYMVNAVAPNVNFTIGLYQITGVGGSPSVQPTFGAAIVGTTVSIVTPPAGGNAGAESAEFSFGGGTSLYALGVVISPTMATNSAMCLTAQLYVYNN